MGFCAAVVLAPAGTHLDVLLWASVSSGCVISTSCSGEETFGGSNEFNEPGKSSPKLGFLPVVPSGGSL